MQFYSTNSPDLRVDLKEAVIRSLPADNGLYMPVTISRLPDTFWENWRTMSFAELGFHVAKNFFQDAIPADDLKAIVDESINFDAPLIPLTQNSNILELFHGPTLAFKDFGARFMARLMAHLTKNDTQELTVLVATSGDTGGAVASAFHNVAGTRVIILYPKGGVSDLQEKQLTTLGGNISALEVEGSFDDCQRMVKSCFLDTELAKKHNLTSANSINISRLLPQSFYYFHAARQLIDLHEDKHEHPEPTFVIPSGNFGNLTAGLIAVQMGLPVRQFVAATNLNDVVPRYLAEGTYEPVKSIATISNAMDVGAPSNFARMQNIFGDSWEAMRESISGLAFDDEETRTAIKQVKDKFNYTIDPHGAVGWLASEIWLEAAPEAHTIILETAHPSKFIDTMEAQLGKGNIEIPERLACLSELEKVAKQVKPDPQEIVDFLG